MSSDHTLALGAHANSLDGRCAMEEWVSHLAGEPHSDAPACVSPVLRVFCTALNDALDDNARQRLRPYLPRTIETTENGLDEGRSWMAIDWLVRVFAPTWLAAVRLRRSADQVAALPPIADVIALKEAIRSLQQAQAESRDAWSASLGAARIVAWVPRGAGRGTAREAAWRPFGRPTWAAAAVAIRTRACDRASAICREIAGDTAATLIRNQHPTGRVRSADLLPMALAPTLECLQQSAFALLDRMLPTVPMPAPGLVGQRTHPIVAPDTEDAPLARADGAPSNR